MSLASRSSPPRPVRRERLEFALPTINVIFLLMLYFLVAGTIVQKDELSVAPPVSERTAQDRLPRPLLVISEEGDLALDGRPVDRAELPEAARQSLQDVVATSSMLNVLAPADMSAAPVLGIVAELSAAGIPVRLVTVDEAAP